MRRNRASRPGFTLVELLAVIGIISALVGILLPATARIRQYAVKVKCQSNLRQLGQAMMIYTSQNREYFPVAWIRLPSGHTVQCWPVRLRPFLRDQRVFYCPAQDATCQWTRAAPGFVAFAQDVHVRLGYDKGERLLIGAADTGSSASGMPFSFGTNTLGTLADPSLGERRGIGGNVYDAAGQLVGRADTRKTSAVKSASEFIVIADTAADGAGDFQVFPRNLAGAGTDNSPGAVHQGGANVLFADGHVKWFLKRDLVIQWPPVSAEAERQRWWNIDHKPART